MGDFTLSQNAFSILRVSPRAKLEEIEEAFEDAVVERPQDEPKLLRLKHELLTPNARLVAELSWLSELAPRRASELLKLLDKGDQEGVLDRLADLPPLSSANIAADAAQRFLSTAFIAPLAEAHVRIRPDDVLTWLNSTRSTAGFGQVQRVHLSEALRALRKQHAAAGLKAVVRQPEPSKALAALFGEFIEPHDPFVGELLREYDQWSSPHLAEIEQDIDAALQEVMRSCGPAVDTLCEQLRAWDELSQPAQMFAQISGLDEERSLRIYRRVRSHCIDLANEQNRYADAHVIAVVMRDLFQELPTAAAELDKDLLALADLSEQENIEAALEPLMSALAKARENIRSITADLRAHGLDGAGTGSPLNALRNALVAAHTALATSQNADAPLMRVRTFALELNNDADEPGAALALLQGAVRCAPPQDPDLGARIARDIRTSRSNHNHGRLRASLDAHRWSEAVLIVEAMLADGPNPAERANLVLVQEQIRQRQNRQILTWLGWGAAALFVIFIFTQQDGGGSTYYSPSTTIDSAVLGTTPTDTGDAVTAVDDTAIAPDVPVDGSITDPLADTAAAEPSDSVVLPPENTVPTSVADSTEVSAPPNATGLGLEPSQLRYCTFEEIRLGALRQLLSGANNDAIERFNGRINDYNARCGSFRARPGELDAAQAAAALATPQLRAEAEAIAQEWAQ